MVTPGNQTNPSIADLSGFADVTKTAEQLKDAYVYQNLPVPLFGGDRNIHDFLADFERATWTLEPFQRTKIVHKAFPLDKYKPWFESTLHPLLEQKASWEKVKEAIVERFSDHETADIHFQKLLQSQYKPGNKLRDFVEEISYWYKKAIGNEQDETGCVKFIKTKLPIEVTSVLNFMPEFKTAINIKQLFKVAKQYDANPISLNLHNNVLDTKYFDGKMEEIKHQVSKLLKNQESMAAAYQQSFRRSPSPSQYTQYQHQYYNNGPHSPYASRPRSNSQERNYKYQNYHGNRTPPSSKSPTNSQPSSPYAKRDHNRGNSPYKSKHSENSNQNQNNQKQKGEGSSAQGVEANKTKFFNEKRYYEKFGYPNKPCVTCGDLHHDRHCVFNLK